MTERLNPFAVAAGPMKSWLDMSNTVSAGLEQGLQELVKIRASQINGCAHCLAMHTADARKAGETEARIYLLNAWREAEHYTLRERAALAWTETLTEVATRRAPEAVYDELAAQFTPEEVVKLTLLINVINGWNRIAIGFGGTAAAPARSAAA